MRLPDLCKTDENAVLGFLPKTGNFRNIVNDHCLSKKFSCLSSALALLLSS
jgi:hypothetical protein